jgi:hypothetical protein
MRIKEIMERVDNPTYDPEAGFLRNVGRAGLDQFTRSQLGGTSAYSYDQEEQRRDARAAQREVDRQKATAQQAAQAINQAQVPAGSAAPQTSAANTQSIAPTPAPAAQTTPVSNFAQGTAGRTTVNVPTAAVPAIRPYVPQVSTATTAAPVQTPAVNPAKPAQVYRFDGRALNPNNPRDANTIRQLQAAGVTSASTGIPRTK